MRRLGSILLLMLSLGTCCKCLAKIDLKSTKPLVIPQDTVTPRITSEDVAKIIPTDIKKDESTSSVMSRIADRTFNAWFNSSTIKNSAVGRIAEKTQEKLKTDVVVAGAKPEDTTHKFSFRIEAFQALAKLEYTGWMKAVVDYDAKVSQTNVEVKEKVFHDKDLVLSHKKNSEQGLSMIGLAWSW